MLATLVYVVDGERVLLIEKRRGHGAGKVNAPGGHVEAGESFEECARREIAEEVGVTVGRLTHRAVLHFHDTAKPFDMTACAFVTTEHEGVARRSPEAEPFWCSIDSIPFARMWEDDRIWVPRVLGGALIEARLVFTDDHLVGGEIAEVESLTLPDATTHRED